MGKFGPQRNDSSFFNPEKFKLSSIALFLSFILSMVLP
jgi:hypothetical protein